MKEYEDMWDADELGLAICSGCAPTHYKDSNETCFKHKHRGKFPKRQQGGACEVENHEPLFKDVLADAMKRDVKYKNCKYTKKRE